MRRAAGRSLGGVPAGNADGSPDCADRRANTERRAGSDADQGDVVSKSFARVATLGTLQHRHVAL